jgi:hypothetical protein
MVMSLIAISIKLVVAQSPTTVSWKVCDTVLTPDVSYGCGIKAVTVMSEAPIAAGRVA